jgi:hypothetical protein
VITLSSGIVIGQANLPIVNRGDALFHVAPEGSLADAGELIDDFEQYLEDAPLLDGT